MAKKLSPVLRDQGDKKEKKEVRKHSKKAPAPRNKTASEEMFRGFIENLPVMLYAVEPDPPYTPIYISPAFEAFGYSIEEWLTDAGMWERVIHPQDRDQIFGGTKRAIFNGEGIDYEYRIIAKDGSLHWVRDRGCFIREENGKPTCWQGVILEITERKLADDALTISEARYRQLFENANDIIYIHDLDGNYISLNQAAENIFGYTRDEALAMNMTEITAPEHLDLVRRKLGNKIKGRTSQTVYEIDCIKKDGTRATLEVNSTVIIKDGEAVAIQGIARDITDRKRAEEAIMKSEERYRDLFENANDLIYMHDLDGNFTSLNRAGELITGYTRDEALRMNITQVVAPEFLEAAKTMIARRVTGEIPSTFELEIIAKAGHRVTLELSTRLIVQDGLPVGVQGIARDISERRQAENSLYNTVSLFASTFESTADGIVVMGLDRRIVTCNRKFVEMWNVPRRILEIDDGARLTQFIARQLADPNDFVEKLDRLHEDSMAAASDVLELKDGRIYERYTQPQFMEGKPVGRVSCFRDITERTLAEAKLRYYALHDTLTDLPNRVEFMTHLERAIARTGRNKSAKFAVLFLDIDRFKVVNDSLGHAIGDKLLVAIAERLKLCVRPGDIVARMGGDEFTILLNRSGDVIEVAQVAERLGLRISEPFKIDNYEVFTSASIGIIVSNDVRRKAEDFLRDADAAMYRAKESGKARYEIFDRDMRVRNMNLLQVETDLRHAVDRNEFEVHYQPIVDLTTGSVQEFEALIRWRHPKHGLIGPNEFVGVAEETGLIIPMGKWILEESCRQIAEWQTRFAFPLSISVNLSAKQLMHPMLTSEIKDLLSQTGLTPGQLKLEVTESTVMEYSEKALKVLSELDQLGISVSTDDFGTGYSSLSYLHRFPFERLKIDRSFIDKMDNDEKSGAIVKTILMLGENLNIEVVAEGIETERQLLLLRALGCELGQGYLFSRPVDAATAEQYLAHSPEIFSLKSAVKFPDANPFIDIADVQ